MKKLSFLIICFIVIFSVLVAGCSTTQTTTGTPALTTSSSTTTVTSSGDTILTVTKDNKTITYTLADLENLPAITGWGGQSTMHGNAVSTQYKGVAMSELLKAVGGMTDKNSLKVTARDDYSRTLTFDQVVNGNFSVSDLSGISVTPSKKPVLFVAYEQSGASLDVDSGPVRLGIMTEQDQLTGGDNWVKELCKIEVISAQ
jgi:hypothetical protein